MRLVMISTNGSTGNQPEKLAALCVLAKKYGALLYFLDSPGSLLIDTSFLTELLFDGNILLMLHPCSATLYVLLANSF